MISCFPRSSYSRISRKMPGRHHHSLVAFLIWCLTASTHAVELTSRRDDGVYFQITPIGQPFCNKPARVLFPNGDAYEGEMTNDKKHGQGKLISPNGAAYEGEWKDDKKHGQGKATYSDGGMYEGEWKDDKKHGQGKLTFAVYDGEWKDDKMHGQGKLTHSDGDVYEGAWKDGKSHFTYLNSVVRWLGGVYLYYVLSWGIYATLNHMLV